MGRKKIYENANERNKAHRQRAKTKLEALKAAALNIQEQIEKNYDWGLIDGFYSAICCVASDLCGQKRVPTARRLLQKYNISRETAASALGPGGGITIACLDMDRVWSLSDDEYEKIDKANLLLLK